MAMTRRSSYPSDVRDEEWAFCAPCLTLMREDAAQRQYSLRSVFNALCWRVHSGTSWRLLPNDLPPWWTVQQQAQRWIQAGCFEALAADMRRLLRWAANPEHLTPTSAILDSRTLQSTPESGSRVGYDGYKRRKGSKIHAAVDRLGQLLAWHVTPANEPDRAQVERLVAAVQAETHEPLQVVYADPGYTGAAPAEAAARQGAERCGVKLPEAKRGFVLLPGAGGSSGVSPGPPVFADWVGTMNA